MSSDFDQRSLDYHEKPNAGKIALKTTKPCETQQQLSMAYTPGVAQPCLRINSEPDTVWKYTAKGNLVAVVSDGTAVLGLGNIGPEAGLPVMEGKAVLFKRFADIDAFPLCLREVFGSEGRTDPEKVITITSALAPSFGGINLEDIAAPACFRIETELKQRMPIPVFHDDQHGTAIISLAGILNALDLVGKEIGKVKLVVNGAGAAGIACAEYYISAGIRRENVIMCDSKGVIYRGRTERMTQEKQKLAAETDARTVQEALVGADIFVGLSVGNLLSSEDVARMAPRAIIFAMANPVPEIYPEDAIAAGAAVVGTGRTDFPNQVNNVLGFPGIFRGALDVRATDITEGMKVGASKGLAEVVRSKVPDEVKAFLTKAYPEDAAAGMFDGDQPLKASYVIPKPFDPRVVPRVARKVAEAAMRDGVAQVTIEDLDAYEASVTERIRRANS